MQCDEAKQKISRRMDAELPVSESRALEEHVSACTGCARFAAQAGRLQKIAEGAAPDAPGEGHWDVLLLRAAGAAVEQSRKLSAHLLLYRAAVGAAAAAVVLLVCLLAFGRPWGPQARVPGHGVAARPRSESYDLAALARLAHHSPDRALREQSAAFQVLSDYFRGGLKWLAQDGAQVEMGVSGAAGGAVSKQQLEPIVLAMELLRVEGPNEARVVSAPSVLMQPGEEADFRMTPKDGKGARRFRYRCWAVRASGGEVVAGVEVNVAAASVAEGSGVKLSGVARLAGRERIPLSFSKVEEAGYLLVVSLREGGRPTSGDRRI